MIKKSQDTTNNACGKVEHLTPLSGERGKGESPRESPSKGESLYYNRATSLCARSEYSPYDIMRKCRDWGLSEAEAESLVERLKEERFIDERRYVHAFVHDKLEYAHWGRVKIQFALRQKHLPDALISEALDEAAEPESYQDALVSLLRQKVARMPRPLSPQDRAKVYRYAASRGYEMDAIARAIGIALEPEP